MPALVEYGLLDGDHDLDPIDIVDRRVDAHRRDDADRIAQARDIYDQAAWDPKIQIYLRSRGIVLASPALRFSAAAPHRLGIRLPAILAPIVNVSGVQTGVHLTYLRCDGSGKADVGSREFQRECRGLVRGGVIRLAEHDPDYPLIIGEGIETTLSAMQLFGRLGWSAVHAGGLKTVELPATVEQIIIVADNDASGAGQRNALAAYDRWTAEGRSVRIKTPPVIGTDFNDLLLGARSR
jgi:phage/plasmid primase-like uncharacterized protein